MAHEFESGFFARQPAWHGLGTVLPEAPKTVQEAYEKSELNWQVNVMPLFANSPDERWINTNGYNAIIRDKDDRTLGIVKGRWTPYQNYEAFDWTIPLVESGNWTYETAGSLRQGEQCWVLLKQNEVEIVPNDLLRQYLMVSWSHDGKSANYVTPTSVRVVCANTMRQALNESGVSRFTVRHSKFVTLNMENTKKLLNITTNAFEEQRKCFVKMAKKKLNKEQIKSVLDELFPVESLEGKSLTIGTQKRDLVETAIERGSGIQENKLAGTAYGVFGGISESVEHFLGGFRIKDRGEHILFRQGKNILDKAFELLSV